jgi:hypothetical protein
MVSFSHSNQGLHIARDELRRLEKDEDDVLSSFASTKSALGRLQHEVDELIPRLAGEKQTTRDYEVTQLELIRFGATQDETKSRIQRLQKRVQADHSQLEMLRNEILLLAEKKAQIEEVRTVSNKSINWVQITHIVSV